MEAAVEHAKDVAREAIRAGLLHPNQARELYDEFQQFVANDVKGSFTQLLLARGAIDTQGFEHLERSCPPAAPDDSQELIDTAALPAYKLREAHGVDPLDPGTGGGSITDDSEDPNPAQHPADASPEMTLGFEDVLPTPDDDLPEIQRTMAFGAVLQPDQNKGEPPADEIQRTMAFGAVLQPGQQKAPKAPQPPQPPAQPAGGAGWGSTVMKAPSDEELFGGEGRRSGVIPLGSLDPGPAAGSGQFAAQQQGSGVIPGPQASGVIQGPQGSGVIPAQGSGQYAAPLGSGVLQAPPAPQGSGVIELPGPPVAPLGYTPIDSTSGDSRSKSGSGSVAQSLPGSSKPDLDLVSDSVAEREADFFNLDSVDDGDEFDEVEEQRAVQIGDVFGNYKLLSELGRGGMGVIYKAERIGGAGAGELYALKTLMAGTGPSAGKRRMRFQREVEALRRLTHANIVGVHDCGRKGAYDYYVMDYIRGRELKQAIKNGELTPRQKLDVFVQICEAVEHAHQRNVIHRDLKPANVLLDEENEAHVLDFGLAKLSDESLELTRTGAALGTPYYMAPEQIQNPKDVDFRVDIFALGVILFELMSEQRPFTGETAGEVTNKIMNEEPVKPSSINDKLRPAFDAICLKAMEKEPDQRYQSVDELRREVAKYRRGDRVRDAGDVAQLKASVRRYVSKHKVPLIVGFALGFAIAWFIRPLF